MTQATIPERAIGSRLRVPIGDLLLDQADLPTVLDICSRAAEEKRAQHVVTANLQFLTVARRSKDFAQMVNRANIVVADGMPLVWLSRLHGAPVPQRITGHDLLHRLAEIAAGKGHSIFLLGGRPGAAEKSALQLQTAYPNLKVAGTFSGRFTEDGLGASDEIEKEALARLRDSRPDFLFVALGCPKQEYWIARHIDQISVPVCVGIGSVLDVVAGHARRAPRWMQRTGLEWLYRLKQEPLRLGRRYLLNDGPTILRLSGLGLARRLRGGARTQAAPGYAASEAHAQLSPENKQP